VIVKENKMPDDNKVPAPPPGFHPVTQNDDIDLSAGLVPKGVTLDMSKSRPLSPAVTLDLSKSRPIPPPGFHPVDDIDLSAGLVPKQPMVTNSAGETMPADVAARHALTREGNTFNTPDAATGTPWESTAKIGNAVIDAVMGAGKEGLKTIQGGVALANRAAKALDPFDSAAHPTPQIPTPAAAADTETHGFAEGVGGFGENVLEYMSGEELLSGLSKVAKLEKLAQSSPTVSKLLSNTPSIVKKVFGGATKAAIVGGAQGAAKGAAEGDALGGAEAGAAGGAIGGAVGEAAAPGVKALARIFGLGGRTAEEAMVAAGRPSVTEDANYRQALQTAAPRIVDAAKDASLKTVGDFEDLLHNTAQDIRQKEFGPMIQRNAKQMVSAQPVAQNIRSAITDQMREYAPEEAKELEDFAIKFAKDMPLAKAESDLQYFNAQLKKFYRANAVDQNAALKTSGTVAKYEAAADGLRDLIYGRLKELGENAPEDLQKQYGALKTLERTFAKRATVSDRQAPLNLAQVLSMAGGLTEAGGAILAGHPVAALAGAIPIAVSTAAKARNAPESLIRQGVKAMTKEAAPKAPSAVGAAAKTGAAAGGAQAGQWIRMQLSDGSHIESHPEDVDEVKKREPGAKVIQ
jgi:hypothetical protein